jgi:outer membrane lipoprotein SlyB
MYARPVRRLRNLALAALLASAGVASAQGSAAAPPAPKAATPPATSEAPRRTCADCAVVESVRYVEEKGQASGVGAVAGGVLGGVLGHQIGSGRGNTVATIAGAGAGAYAGHQVEKNRNRKSYWTVAVRMDDGRHRTLTYSAKPAVNQGERVKLVDGGKRLALLAP